MNKLFSISKIAALILSISLLNSSFESSFAEELSADLTSQKKWDNESFSRQSQEFEIEFDMMSSENNADAVVGLSEGSANAYSDLAVSVRFNTNGKVDVRDAAVFRSEGDYSYVKNTLYHVRLKVNVDTHTYDTWIKKGSSKYSKIGSKYKFRSEQSSVASLSNIAAMSKTSATLRVSSINLKPTSEEEDLPTPIPTPEPKPTPVPLPTPIPEDNDDGKIPSDAKFIHSNSEFQEAIRNLRAGDFLVLDDGKYTGGINLKQNNVTIRALKIRKLALELNEAKRKEIISQMPTIAIEKSAGDNLRIDADNITLRGVVLSGGGPNTSSRGALADNRFAAVRFVYPKDEGGGSGHHKKLFVEDCAFTNASGVGFSVNGDEAWLSRLVSFNNGAAGIGGSHGKDITLIDSILHHNNDRETSNGGGGKWTRTNNMVIDNLRSYQNIGPGIWFDNFNINSTVQNSYAFRNKGTLVIHGKGIMFELSGGDKNGEVDNMNYVRNNIVQDNDVESGRDRKLGFRGILMSSSAHFLVENNSILEDDTIYIKHGKRDDGVSDREVAPYDITIQDNYFAGDVIYDLGKTAAKGYRAKESNNSTSVKGAGARLPLPEYAYRPE